MKYMKMSDLEPGDKIKFNLDYLYEIFCGDWFIFNVARLPWVMVDKNIDFDPYIELQVIVNSHPYILFINKENNRNIPFEIIELGER